MAPDFKIKCYSALAVCDQGHTKMKKASMATKLVKIAARNSAF
jgi:hypothetical protein